MLDQLLDGIRSWLNWVVQEWDSFIAGVALGQIPLLIYSLLLFREIREPKSEDGDQDQISDVDLGPIASKLDISPQQIRSMIKLAS